MPSEQANREHPANAKGEDRVCPITGAQFREVYTDLELFDSCDQCRPNIAKRGGEWALRDEVRTC